MSTATTQAADQPNGRTAPNAILTTAERIATGLVAFIFAINLAFMLYMISQFFVVKPYSNGLHFAYTLIVTSNVVLLAYSTRCFWTLRVKRGCYAFFSAILVSGVANAVIEHLT